MTLSVGSIEKRSGRLDSRMARSSSIERDGSRSREPMGMGRRWGVGLPILSKEIENGLSSMKTSGRRVIVLRSVRGTNSLGRYRESISRVFAEDALVIPFTRRTSRLEDEKRIRWLTERVHRHAREEMTRLRFLLLGPSVLLISGCSNPLSSGDGKATLRIFNTNRFEIYSVYISKSSDGSWGENRFLKSRLIQEDQWVDFTVK
jgi:hypothetical protein